MSEPENLPVKDEPYDTSDPEQVNKAKKRASRKREDRLKFVAAAMQHPEGRAWFYDQLVFCKVFSTPYTENPYDTAFRCGQANIGLRILADIQDAASKEYLLMIEENK